jgi:apolipoprotein N-acyltransferase
VAITVPALKYLGWLLCGAYLGLYWGLAALLGGWLARRGGRGGAWTFVPAMLVVEELRGSGELGFPWFQPGYTQGALPPVLQLAALGSVTLVTLWLLLVNAGFAHAWRRRSRAALAGTLVLLALPFVHAGLVAWRPAGTAPGVSAERRLRLLLVQGNIPGEIKWSGRHQQQILATFLSLSDSAVATAAGGEPQLVVWPETATGSYLRKQPEQAIAVAQFASRTGVPVFTGYADYAFDETGRPRPYNSAGQFLPGGEISEPYAKRHLVPFGERMPFQWLVPAIGKLDLGQAEWVPGTRTVLFGSEAGPFACLICFESIFSDLARRDVRAGARWLVVVTNDEWFGNSAALYQHAAMAPFRAVETGVSLVRVANTGVTAVFDRRGRTVAQAPVFEPVVLEAWLDRDEAARWRPTPFVRWGDWPGVLAALAAAALALGAGRHRRPMR